MQPRLFTFRELDMADLLAGLHSADFKTTRKIQPYSGHLASGGIDSLTVGGGAGMITQNLLKGPDGSTLWELYR
jgi:hypothetical protein